MINVCFYGSARYISGGGNISDVSASIQRAGVMRTRMSVCSTSPPPMSQQRSGVV